MLKTTGCLLHGKALNLEVIVGRPAGGAVVRDYLAGRAEAVAFYDLMSSLAYLPSSPTNPKKVKNPKKCRVLVLQNARARFYSSMTSR